MADADGVCFFRVDFVLVTHQAREFSTFTFDETEGNF